MAVVQVAENHGNEPWFIINLKGALAKNFCYAQQILAVKGIGV